MRPIEQLKAAMNEDEARRVGIDAMSEDQLAALANWGMRMYHLGLERAGGAGGMGETVGDIDEVKYDGRLIILTDGSRWEVDAGDEATADLWSPMDRVVVIDGDMYRLDDSERVGVAEES